MSRKRVIAIVLILAIIFSAFFIIFNKNGQELQTIKSEKQLFKIYKGNDSTTKEVFLNIVTMPFSLFDGGYNKSYGGIIYDNDMITNSTSGMLGESITMPDSIKGEVTSSSKDYSTTNIQVENVDEADITKTDGDYIYSISENKVIITSVINPEKIEIVATINLNSGSIPEDLILYNNKLVVIATKNVNGTSWSYRYDNTNTEVRVFDITVKEKPNLLKSYELYEPYYTSRCIDNVLYVISSGRLREDDDKIERVYREDNVEQEIKLKNIKYLKSVKTTNQTLISVVDLNNPKEKIKLDSYLMDISNAYVSENSIYLLNQKYEHNSYAPPISSLFGLKGAIGAFTYDYDSENSGYYTEIYKFSINKEGNVDYKTKTNIKGKTINQYSLDELNGHLRVALYDNEGARVAIFDENLKQIGISDYVAKGETMYSSRFIGNKVYLVTFKTMDPLFVIDLSDETNPKVLGELHIPGYSTYLHPYDENHLIGIGMQTEEIVNRNLYGKVTSTTSRIIGMKMALFDVSDVHNPVQISETVIGDSRTTSAILNNPKALLFSKEKNLIAIPVNNYSEDFSINSSSDSHESIINSYKNYNKTYVAEGYFVYNINIEDGFNLKGVITHEASKNTKYYYNTSKLLRGLYIENNLYTVSETAVKVNDLETLELIDELKIK